MKRKLKNIVCASALLLWGFSPSAPVFAQAAEVPTPNADGDFTTARVMGNRGMYNNSKWLVVDPDPTYLNCRRIPNGEVVTRLPPGATVTAVFNGRDAIDFSSGKPWLRVRLDPSRFFSRYQGICYLRANIKYVAPINEDFLNSL